MKKFTLFALLSGLLLSGCASGNISESNSLSNAQPSIGSSIEDVPSITEQISETSNPSVEESISPSETPSVSENPSSTSEEISTIPLANWEESEIARMEDTLGESLPYIDLFKPYAFICVDGIVDIFDGSEEDLLGSYKEILEENHYVEDISYEERYLIFWDIEIKCFTKYVTEYIEIIVVYRYIDPSTVEGAGPRGNHIEAWTIDHEEKEIPPEEEIHKLEWTEEESDLLESVLGEVVPCLPLEGMNYFRYNEKDHSFHVYDSSIYDLTDQYEDLLLQANFVKDVELSNYYSDEEHPVGYFTKRIDETSYIEVIYYHQFGNTYEYRLCKEGEFDFDYLKYQDHHSWESVQNCLDQFFTYKEVDLIKFPEAKNKNLYFTEGRVHVRFEMDYFNIYLQGNMVSTYRSSLLLAKFEESQSAAAAGVKTFYDEDYEIVVNLSYDSETKLTKIHIFTLYDFYAN